jgi:hypothetical protein
VTAIRNKLLKEKFYSTCAIPDFKAIGCELMTLLHFTFNTTEKRDNLLQEIAKIPEVICSVSSNSDFIGIAVSSNLTHMKKFTDTLSRQLKQEQISKELQQEYFPLDLSKINLLFIFAPYLASILEAPDSSTETIEPTVINRRLTLNEKLILFALVKYPDLNDSDISLKTGVPRPSISQTRRKLITEGLLRVRNIPSLGQLRIELMVFSQIKFDFESEKDKNSLCKAIQESPSTVFMVTGNDQIIYLGVFSDYTEYESDRNSKTKILAEFGIQIDSTYILPYSQIQDLKMDFSSIVKKVLDIQTDF